MTEAVVAAAAPKTLYHAPGLQEYLERLRELHPRLCRARCWACGSGCRPATAWPDLPHPDKSLLTMVETDGCFADGVSVATGCWFGRRTLRLLDYGKVAATFVDLHGGRAVRVRPCGGIRERAWAYAPSARDHWHAQLVGYQTMLSEELLRWRQASMADRLDVVLGQAGRHVTCIACGEEAPSGRELSLGNHVLCRPCARREAFELVTPRCD